mmetsp:Transcript_28810/g.81167  ORF Transcript_28810/g.81167 Transcript_28810/m.81167 type:complete len:615 (+) Transcript_28810:188-2032(+)
MQPSSSNNVPPRRKSRAPNSRKSAPVPGPPTAQPKQKKKPQWDSYCSDLDRFKLNEEEQKRKLAARKSRHMLRRSPVKAPNDALRERGEGEDCEVGKENSGSPQANYPLHKDTVLDLSGGRRRGSGLDFRGIAKVLQTRAAKNSLAAKDARDGGSPGQEDERDKGPAGVVDFEAEVRDFMMRRLATTRSGGVSSKRGGGLRRGSPSPPRRLIANHSSPAVTPAHKQPERGHPDSWPPSSESSEEEEGGDGTALGEHSLERQGHQPPASPPRDSGAYSSELQEMTLRALAAEAGAALPMAWPVHVDGAGEQAMAVENAEPSLQEARQEIEALRKELSDLKKQAPQELKQLTEEVQSLKQSYSTLSHEFSDFRSHTTSVLTQLQGQFAQLLAASRGGGGAPRDMDRDRDRPRAAASGVEPLCPPAVCRQEGGRGADRQLGVVASTEQPVARPPGSAPVPTSKRKQEPPPLPGHPSLREGAGSRAPADEETQLPSFSDLRGSTRGQAPAGPCPPPWALPEAYGAAPPSVSGATASAGRVWPWEPHVNARTAGPLPFRGASVAEEPARLSLSHNWVLDSPVPPGEVRQSLSLAKHAAEAATSHHQPRALHLSSHPSPA